MKDAPHIGLARKYRPQQFKDIVGQEAVSTTLANAVGEEKPAQAYLFFGPKGVGKTTSARILAKALNCKKGPTAEPCGKCPSCREITGGTSIDVLELDAASNTQVDKIREMIIETVSLAPSRDRFKVFIIDEVHMLSTSSFNALLKTLEEPPAHAIFILATTELAKIPPTIVSRCQRFRFRPIPRDIIAEHLGRLAKAEKIKTEPAALELLARAAGGALRDAVSLLDQTAAFSDGNVTRDKVGELMGTLPEEAQLGFVGAVLDKDAARLTEWLENASAEGFEATQLLRDLRERLQEMYLFRMGVETSAGEAWTALAEGHPPETFSFLLKRVNRTLFEMRSADSPQQAFELGIYSMLESAYDLRQWVQRLEALEKRLASGEPAGKAVPAPRTAEKREPPQKTAPSRKAVPQKKAASPAAPSAPPVVEDVWPAVLDKLDDALPSISGGLSESRLLPNDGGEWKLVFKDAFNRDRAQAHIAVIEKTVSDIAGRRIKLDLEVGKSSGAEHEKSKARPKSQEGWVDTSEDSSNTDPAMKKLLGTFEGARVKRVRKKSG